MSEVSTEEMERLGALLPNMTVEQLRLVKNRIEQILFERALGADKEFIIKVLEDPDSALGVKVEIPPKMQKALDDGMAELKKALKRLGRDGERGPWDD